MDYWRRVPDSRNRYVIGLFNQEFRSSAIVAEFGTATSFPHHDALTYTATNEYGIEDTKTSTVTVANFCADLSRYCNLSQNDESITDGWQDYDTKAEPYMDADGDGCIEPSDIKTLQDETNGVIEYTKGGIKDWDKSGSIGVEDLIVGFVCARRVRMGCSDAMPVSTCNGHTLGEPDHGLSIAHEVGHLIGGLGDEYTAFTPEVSDIGKNGFQGTLSACQSSSQNTKWGDLLEQPDGMNGTVGCYEGHAGQASGIYRPTQTSLMRDTYPVSPFALNFGKVNERIITQEINSILEKSPCA